MVHINKNLGNLNVGGLAKAKGTKVQNEEKENFTQVEPLQIWRYQEDGTRVKIFDDMQKGKVIYLNPDGSFSHERDA
jgi:hypothetical protein